MTQYRQEVLGHIKMALANTDTSSLLNILQAHFGQAELLESDEEEDVWVGEEKTFETPEETTAKPQK